MNNGLRACPLCSASEASTYMKPTSWNNRDGIELKKCKPCGFVYSAAVLHDYTTGNHRSSVKTEDPNKQQLPLLTDEIIEKSELKKGKVLDFGCGIGLLLLCLQKRGLAAYGIETSKFYLDKHKECNITSATSLESLNAPKNSFDLIIIKDVLEHADNPRELLQELLSYVKPSGHFYIRVPNVYGYKFHWSVDTKTHINHFSPKTLTQLVEQQGMEKNDFVGVYDISTKVGKLYNFVFWKTKYFLPMYHQISLLYQKR